MSLKTQQLQAAYARRRESEHQRIERSAALNQYYDHWGKVTSRYGNWTTPEYYKQADEQLRETREKKERKQQMEEKRCRLRDLLNKEKVKLEAEMKDYMNPRMRKRTPDTETLAKIEQNAKETANIKRKLELEAKLYGRMRHGVDDDNVLFQSKSDQETLAKLNWLDKQVEGQLAREKEEALAQERNLRLQQEINKTEQLQKERQEIREQEIREIRALQDHHMDQLKERQSASDSLKEQETQIRTQIGDLTSELDLLVDSSALMLEPATSAGLSNAYNLNKIKLLIRKRAETFCNQIKLVISILERVKDYATRGTHLKALLQKYAEQCESSTKILHQIDGMYESEAKSSLQHCEEQWQSDHLQRYHDVQQLLKEEQCALSQRLNDNLQRQQNLIELRSTHLSAIESSNTKLNQLMKEHEDSPRSLSFAADKECQEGGDVMTDTSRDQSHNKSPPSVYSCNSVPSFTTHVSSRRSFPQVSTSFAHLNLDGCQNMPDANDVDSARLQSQRSLQFVTPENAVRPRYARRHIAWT